MRWNTKDSYLSDNCEEEAKVIFAQNYLFTRGELITSLECQLDYLQEEKGLTEKSRNHKMKLYKRFIDAIKKCKLPELSPDSWRHYEYYFTGYAITLELCSVEELEFHDNEVDGMTFADNKELLYVESEYVGTQEFAEIQNVKESTVVRWINAGKLKCAKLNGNTWEIPTVQDKPKRNEQPADYLIDEGLKIDEYPFVQYSDEIFFFEEDDRKNYRCIFNGYKTDFREEMVLSKKEVERLEYLLIASGNAKINGYCQWMPMIK